MTGHVVVCSLQENYSYLRARLEEVAGRHGERVLSTPNNPISIGEPKHCYGVVKLAPALFS